MQPWCTPFLIWNQSVVPCPVLTVASWPTHRFLKRQVRLSGIPISLRIFQSFSHSSQGDSKGPMAEDVSFSNWRQKRWKYQTTWPASWEICMHVRKHQLELDMEKRTGSKSRKEYIKAIYCHPAYLTYMHHEKCWAGRITSWNPDCQEKYQ